MNSRILLYLALHTTSFAQSVEYPYVIKKHPYATTPDAGGNLFILDSATSRIRRVTPDGRISTAAEIAFSGRDMTLAADGSFYIAGSRQVIQVSPDGVSTVVAGTGVYGFSGDGGPAVNAELGTVNAIALDSSGNIYFTDTGPSGYRVRQVISDGRIRTIAGNATCGFNGDNQPAATSSLCSPAGLAVDKPGVYDLTIQIPEDVPSGDSTLEVQVGSYWSPSAAFITIQPQPA